MEIPCAELAEFLDSPDFEAVVGSNAAAFRKMWTRALDKNRARDTLPPQMGAIWWMLLAGPFWLAYRRLYRYFTIWLGLFVVSCLVDIVAPYPSVSLFNNIVMLAVNITFMYHGGRWYLEHCLHLHRQGRSMGDAAERAAFWRREGGVNWLAVLLALAAVAVITLGLASLMPDELVYYDIY